MPIAQTVLISGDSHALVLFDTRNRDLDRKSLTALHHPLMRMLVDWARKTCQRIIQVLPMNDTTTTHTRTDSYPYSAISIYALHPMYISLPDLGELADPEKAAFFARKRT